MDIYCRGNRADRYRYQTTQVQKYYLEIAFADGTTKTLSTSSLSLSEDWLTRGGSAFFTTSASPDTRPTRLVPGSYPGRTKFECIDTNQERIW
ncbi:MAG TPA: hypothetical protein H9819_07250 [Candidatus Bacteroides merdipullorum]|uniref:Uncharacterized protein n=1 Tax=Candidatus Bacteroides merdipullorum TaxID=2838474 RepID=A0A9D2A5Y6_9BACE|nr:hypothetical protein [Candidatus Bacteroides merdipullorum]